MTWRITYRKFSLVHALILSLILVVILVSSIQYYPHGQHQIIDVYASPSNTTLYFDCGNTPNKLTIQALPVTPNEEYTMWLYETNIKFGNSTTTTTSGQANTLGNGESFFNAVFTVPSMDKNMYLAALFSGNDTSTSPIAKGASRCYTGANTLTDTQTPEQQCLTLIGKNKEVNGVKLTEENCKPMTQRNIK
jgi:hypothetical protein